MNNSILIPVDFHLLSFDAVSLGFQLARRLEAKPVILHAFSPVYMPEQPPIFDSFDFTDQENLIEEDEMENDIARIANRQMAKFVYKINALVADGKLPDVKFSHIVSEGVPEDVIRSYVRTNTPIMVVMATKGKDRKLNDLLGSVAAEVLDTCRIPIFTVPENPVETPVADIDRIGFFCSLDGSDKSSIDYLVNLLGPTNAKFILIPVPSKEDAKNEPAYEQFCDYCVKSYPDYVFMKAMVPEKDFRQNLENCISQQKIQLLVVPNRKTNIFTRLFNPSIPHRVLFEKDIPMLAIPT